MKFYYSRSLKEDLPIEEDITKPNIYEDIKKTRYALEIAYAGFDNAVEPELIDSYIYEINSLQKRYDHLLELTSLEKADLIHSEDKLHQKSPIRALVSHVLS